MEAVERAATEKSPGICKKYSKGKCKKHMFDTFQHPADPSCRFTHGNREQTGKVACHFAADCTDMGCPYMHPPERQAKAVDMAGDLIS